jgi:L-ascorbate metabolism protein UlaG (beta-lactamase superfamily)
MGDGREPRFLRSNVIIEPLVDRFYAWLYTVAPVQAAMNLASVQVPLLESYLQNPQVHIAASNNPDLRGGSFVGIEEERSAEVGDLLDSIKRDRVEMLGFAAAVAEAEELVRQNATGFDLTSLYPKLPPALNGLVELAYDTSRQPTIHFSEPLAYESAAYDERRQSVQLSLDSGAARPFILSTPRLPSPEALELSLPFHHPGLQELVKARIQPTNAARLREALELNDAQAVGLNALLDARPSVATDRHIDARGRIRYFGHACLVLQTPRAAIVTDPFISTDNKPGDRYTLDDLPDHIDLVLITHGHQDHLVLETLLQLRGRVGAVVVPRSCGGNLCDPSMRLYLRHLGLPVVEVDDFDEVAFPGGKVVATPFLGEHAELDIRGKSTYWVELAGASVFVGADSSGIDPVVYRYVRAHLGRVNLAFLGMGSNAAQACAMVTELGADEAYVYAMGEESWQGHVMAATHNKNSNQLTQIDEFLGWCADRGITAEHLFNKREWRW